MLYRQLNDGSCKTYLLVSEKTREAVLIDPLLGKVQAYLDKLKKEDLRLRAVIDTHTHADHISGCAALRDKLGVRHMMHAATKTAGVTDPIPDNHVLSYGDLSLTFLHTPGHTTDSLTLLTKGRVFSGDFLFIGKDGAGRLDLPGSDPGTHFDTLSRLDGLADDSLVLPAHDYQGLNESTLGAERKTNPVLSPRTREAYIRWWTERRFGPADWMKDVVKANLSGTKDPNIVRIPKEGAACACVMPAGVNEAELPSMSASELNAKLRENPKGFILLDVRTDEEYTGELGHIAGTMLIPVDELPGRISEVPPGPVISICRSGKRASKAALELQKAGRKVWVLTGGMLAWNEEGFPTT